MDGRTLLYHPVRDGMGLASAPIRFSGGFAGPERSITGRLTGPVAALAPSGIQDQPHVSTAVVSKALAGSAGQELSVGVISGAVK
jgi:hypothetical protein